MKEFLFEKINKYIVSDFARFDVVLFDEDPFNNYAVKKTVEFFKENTDCLQVPFSETFLAELRSAFNQDSLFNEIVFSLVFNKGLIRCYSIFPYFANIFYS